MKESTECDIVKTQTIADLIKTPRNNRDENWNNSFLANVQMASFACGDPQVMTGPDSFPYFVLKMPEPQKAFESFCIRNLMEDYLLENGYGVTINPGETSAEWVFSYGDIVNLKVNNEFYSKPVDTEIKETVTIEKNEEILIAQPSETYLPKKTRTVLKSYLQYYGVKEPKIMLINRKENGKMIQELAINVFKEETRRPELLPQFMQQVGWFLPKHYILVLVPLHSSITQHFEEL